MKILNLNEVNEVEEFDKVTAGGYICGITSVEDVPEKEYLRIEYDIADGKLKNYYRTLYNNKGFWGASTIRSYKDKALPFFKAFITAIEQSNKNYKWDNDESKLVRKLIGFVLGEEEYLAKDGSIKTRLYVAKVTSVDKIKKGEFDVPALKKLSPTVAASATVTDDVASLDVPF